MYNIPLLTSLTDDTSSLIGLVGARQPSDPEYPTYTASLLESRSGRYLQDQHALLTSKNIDQCADDFDGYIYPSFDISTGYSQGDKVLSGGVNYEYINPVPSTGNTPPNTTYWTVITAPVDYLLNRQRQAITEVLDDCFNEKKVKQLSKSVFENISLFTGQGNVNQKEINAGKFVGFKIKLRNSRGLLAILNRIGTQFSESVNFTLYIFHSSQSTAIATVSISHNTGTSFKWTTAGNELRFFSYDYDAGGAFYVGYFQDDIGAAMAIKKDYDWSRGPCGGCTKESLVLYKTWSEFMVIEPIEVASGHLNGTNLFDIDYVAYNYSNNYGLNLNVTVKCDLTDFIKENETQLGNAIAYKWALIQLNDIAYNVRGNVLSERTKKLALMEMDEKKSDSMVNKYKGALKAMSFDFSTLDDSCLPCENKWGAIWSDM